MAYRTSEQTQIRKNLRRRQIIEAAIKVFAEHGYHDTSVKNIVDEAKTSVGNFYFYFKSKEDIFESLYNEMHNMIDGFIDAMIDQPRYNIVEKFCIGAAASLWVYQKYYELTRVLFIEAVGLDPLFEKKRAEIIASSRQKKINLFRHLQQKNKIKVPDIDVAAMAMEGSYLNVITVWLQSENAWILTSTASSLAILNLQMLGIPYNENEAQKTIQDFLKKAPYEFDAFVSTGYDNSLKEFYCEKIR